MSINIFQIYYNEETRKECYPEYRHILNKTCTPFFENSVIRDLIRQNQHKEGDFFGVFSPKFRYKIDDRCQFTPQRFNDFILKFRHFDVFSVHKYHGKHNQISLAEQYHPDFTKILQAILSEIKYRANLNLQTRFIIYSNHFVAKSQVYEDYVNQLLSPAMEVMSKQGTEIYQDIWKNSHYQGHGLLPGHLKQVFGVGHYPYHTFLCERLPGIWLNQNQHIKCINL